VRSNGYRRCAIVLRLCMLMNLPANNVDTREDACSCYSLKYLVMKGPLVLLAMSSFEFVAYRYLRALPFDCHDTVTTSYDHGRDSSLIGSALWSFNLWCFPASTLNTSIMRHVLSNKTHSFITHHHAVESPISAPWQ
jgi:hypothetical protein